MKILHVDETFHPAFGYQCNPLAKFQSKQGHDVTIIAPDAKHIHPVYHEFGDHGESICLQDKEYEDSTGVSITRIEALGHVSGRLVYRYPRLFRAIEAINPDVIMVHCMETLTAVMVLKKFGNRFPLVFDSHMLAMASKNPLARAYESLYKRFVSSEIAKKRFPVIKTQNDDYVTSHLGIPEDQTIYISFGTDTDLFCPDPDARKQFCSLYGLDDSSRIVVSTGKLTDSKGGMLFADGIKEKFDGQREVVFVVVANFAGEYEQGVKMTLDLSGNRVIYFPVQNYLSLPYFYQIADAAIFPKQCSMSFFDAQACGCLSISENNNINIERNSHSNGLCFESGNLESLRSVILRLANMEQRELDGMKANAVSYIKRFFDYEDIARKYTEVIEIERDSAERNIERMVKR